jgi:hypothetical protein
VEAPAPATLETDWEWTSSVGGITGKQITTPATTGVTRKYVFRADGTFIQYDNGQEVQRATYVRGQGTSLLYNDQRDIITVNYRIVTPSGTLEHSMRYLVDRLSSAELVLREDVFDGFLLTFQKK